MGLALEIDWKPLAFSSLCVLWGYLQYLGRKHSKPDESDHKGNHTGTVAHSPAYPVEYALICEFLCARELALVQFLSKEWRAASRHQVCGLLKEKLGGDALQQISRRSLSQRLYHLETRDLIPLWTDKPVPERERLRPGMPCPRLGHLVMQIMKHSNNNEWHRFHTGAGSTLAGSSLFEIHPRESFEAHPFGTLQLCIWEDSNRLQLIFVRNFTTTAFWSFKIVDRTWYLTGQSSNMKPGFKICTKWSPDRLLGDEAYRPEFRERNAEGVGILEEANVFWHEIQQHFLEPEYHVHYKPPCSLPSCGCLHAKNRCSRCQLSYYCSRDHQAKHWKKHKVICQRRCSTTDIVGAYRNVERVNEQEISVFDIMRRRGMDLTTGSEWYLG